MDLQRTTVLLFILALPALLQGCEPRPTEPAKTPLPGTDEVMDRILEHCRKNIGTPQIRQITNRVWVATGYALANTVILKAGEGYVVVDPGMNAARAGAVRQDFFKRHKPGPVRAIVYTHSHIDHVGGAERVANELERAGFRRACLACWPDLSKPAKRWKRP